MNKKTEARVAAIVVKDGALLLMYRERADKKYYAFPGGTVEAQETLEQALVREVLEETSITVLVGPLVLSFDATQSAVRKHEYFYVCEYVSGEPTLNPLSVEVARMALGKQEVYKPLWVPIENLKNLCVYPVQAQDFVLKSCKP